MGLARKLGCIAGLAVTVALMGSGAWANALDLTQRKIQVSGKLDVSSATKLGDKLIQYESLATAPIYMQVSCTSGTAQGVQLLADTIRSLESPVVAVVTTHVRGACAAVVPFADQAVIYPSAGLVFTEVPYEGIDKYEPPKKPKKKPKKKDDEEGTEGEAQEEEPEEEAQEEERKPREIFLQEARAKYLDAFYARLVKRTPWRLADFKKRLEKDGGVQVTADEAVKKKLAVRKVDRITYRNLPEVKREEKRSKTVKEETTAPR